MRPVGETVAHLERGGLEVRDVHALREHYVLTVAGWLERFEANVERLTELVGEEVVRVWRLYLVGGAMAFRDGRMGVDQILLVRPGARPRAAPGALVVSDVLAGAARRARHRGGRDDRRRPWSPGPVGRVAVVDVAWGLGFVAVAAVVAVVADEGAVRRWVLLVLVAVWGLRLAWHIRRRAVGHGEDPRYEALLGGPVREVGFAVAVRKVFLVQGVALWFVSLPVQVGGALAVRWWPVVVGRRAACGWSAWSSRRSATPSSRRTRPTPTAARSWTAACGAGPGTPTTSATPASGGASGWSAASRPAGCPGC